MSKATGTYPAYVSTPPPPGAQAPSASAPQQAVINSQGQNLAPSSDQFQVRLCACAPARKHPRRPAVVRPNPGAFWRAATSRLCPTWSEALALGA